MDLGHLPSIRVSDMRRSAALTMHMAQIRVTLQGSDGTQISTEVGVVRFRMRSGGVFLQFIWGCCGQRAQVLQLHESGIMCGRVFAIGAKASQRFVAIERLKAMRFHGGPVTQCPGRMMERREELMAALRRSKLDPHSAQFRCEVVATIACGIMIPHTCDAGRRELKFMPRRGSDADSRIFFDELVSLAASRLKATGAIRFEDRHCVIAFGDKQKLVGVSHTVFRNGGAWSYFICPRCGGRKKKLWLVEDAPRCLNCCWSLGVRYRSAYGFGRAERLRERDRRVDKLQAMLEGGPMRLKPVPPNWGNRRLDRRNRLTATLQRARIATRLAQIAYQHQQSSEAHGLSPLLRAYKPLAAALEAIPNLKSLWLAKSTEDIQIALDKAQSTILEALQSNDPQTRLNAASLMLRSRQARERGWC